MEANRTQVLRRMDYLLRQLHLEALRRREEFTEVIYLRTHIRIPPSAFRVIDRLRVKATRVSDLATELRESLPTIARLVQQLEAKGLVERSRDETDARASIVRLSPLGVGLEQTMRMERQDHIDLCLDDWSDDQLAELLPLLERLTADFTRHESFTEPWEESFETELAQAVENSRAGLA
jgi:DNA-binding MarR family transcriptional regulator